MDEVKMIIYIIEALALCVVNVLFMTGRDGTVAYRFAWLVVSASAVVILIMQPAVSFIVPVCTCVSIIISAVTMGREKYTPVF
jgi:hypothetical protein